MNRGVEIASEIADGPQSVIGEQVEMGVAVRMAVMEALLLAGQNMEDGMTTTVLQNARIVDPSRSHGRDRHDRHPQRQYPRIRQGRVEPGRS